MIVEGLVSVFGLAGKTSPARCTGGGHPSRVQICKSFLLIVLILLLVLFPLCAEDTRAGSWSSQEKSRRASLRVSAAPYSLALYRFYNGYDTASTRTKTQSVYGFAASLDLNLPLFSRLSIYPELGYHIVIKETTIIPSAKKLQYLKAGAGVDFTFNLNEKATIFTGVFGGAMVHINNNKASITSYFGTRIGLDYKLGDHFWVGALSRVSVALFAGRSEKLMDSVTVLVEPVSITLTYKL